MSKVAAVSSLVPWIAFRVFHIHPEGPTPYTHLLVHTERTSRAAHLGGYADGEGVGAEDGLVRAERRHELGALRKDETEEAPGRNATPHHVQVSETLLSSAGLPRLQVVIFEFKHVPFSPRHHAKTGSPPKPAHLLAMLIPKYPIAPVPDDVP